MSGICDPRPLRKEIMKKSTMRDVYQSNNDRIKPAIILPLEDYYRDLFTPVHQCSKMSASPTD